MLFELEHAQPGSYLVSGYRGSGKTSFINRVAESISGFMVVELNVAKSLDYPILVKKIIRQLYLQYVSYCSSSGTQNKEFDIEFKLLYDRTFNDIVHSQAVSFKDEEKSETKFEFNLKKLLPYILVVLSATGITLDLSPNGFNTYC